MGRPRQHHHQQQALTDDTTDERGVAGLGLRKWQLECDVVRDAGRWVLALVLGGLEVCGARWCCEVSMVPLETGVGLMRSDARRGCVVWASLVGSAARYAPQPGRSCGHATPGRGSMRRDGVDGWTDGDHTQSGQVEGGAGPGAGSRVLVANFHFKRPMDIQGRRAASIGMRFVCRGGGG